MYNFVHEGFPYSGKVSHRQYRQEDYISHAEILHESSLNLFLRSGSMGRLGIGGEVKGEVSYGNPSSPSPLSPIYILLPSFTLSGKYSTCHIYKETV